MTDRTQQDPVLKAGATPLPYVQVGMVLRPLAAASWPHPDNLSTWTVTDIYAESPRSTIVRLLMTGSNVVLERHSSNVRGLWTLAEDFNPNGGNHE